MDSFTLNIHGGYNIHNEPLSPSTESMKGLYMNKNKLVIDKDGEEVVSSGHIFIDYLSTITLEDTVTIGGIKKEIIAIEQPKNFTDKRTVVFLK
ncbi:MAG: hypothetical protein KAR20_05865, partial [Candidatus Heimdallarchaeota archaeon]|nr:hypothetical protein [Candidatus Heimdallarchaeota archaeon]